MNTTTNARVPSPADPSLGQVLADHHKALDRSFEALIARAQGGDPVQLRREWASFERQVLRHFDLEEAELLPRFAREDATGARAILEEHAAIRDALVELGVNLDLHLLRAEAVQRFCDQLKAHARREEAALYPWAERHGPRGGSFLDEAFGTHR